MSYFNYSNIKLDDLEDNLKQDRVRNYDGLLVFNL